MIQEGYFISELFGPALLGIVAGAFVKSVGGFFDEFNGLVQIFFVKLGVSFKNKRFTFSAPIILSQSRRAVNAKHCFAVFSGFKNQIKTFFVKIFYYMLTAGKFIIRIRNFIIKNFRQGIFYATPA